MIAGQPVDFLGSLTISVLGMAVVMFELVLLAFFIFVMSKVIAAFGWDKKTVKKTASPQPVSVPDAAAQVPFVGEDDDIAAIITAVCVESGFKPEEIVFKSISGK